MGTFNNFVKATAILRIVVPTNYNWFDILIHLIWILVGFASSVGNACNSFFINDFETINSYMISYIVTDIFLILLTTVPIPAIAYFVVKNDYFVTEANLPNPYRFGQFMVTFILHFLSLVIMAWTYLPNMLNYYLLTSLLVLIFFFFVVATNTILFIGTDSNSILGGF